MQTEEHEETKHLTESWQTGVHNHRNLSIEPLQRQADTRNKENVKSQSRKTSASRRVLLTVEVNSDGVPQKKFR